MNFKYFLCVFINDKPSQKQRIIYGGAPSNSVNRTDYKKNHLK